jgi:hypothetical protein
MQRPWIRVAYNPFRRQCRHPPHPTALMYPGAPPEPPAQAGLSFCGASSAGYEPTHKLPPKNIAIDCEPNP